MENAPKIHKLQAKMKESEDHIKLSHANKATEKEELKKLLLQSANCVPSNEDSIKLTDC